MHKNAPQFGKTQIEHNLIFIFVEGSIFHYIGIRIDDIVKLSVDEHNIDPDVKKANVRSLTTHLLNVLHFYKHSHESRFHKTFNQSSALSPIMHMANSALYVSTLYLLTKVLYAANVVGQLILMNRFLVNERHDYYGFGLMTDMLNGTTSENSRLFPRVTLCDFKVRRMLVD